ncbi:Sortilin-related receptor [Trichoplax sp. H2]|nr:Sortilin-related receptor [Trichoplax sp. H2]|eukprot:RDD42760.1 Sortilin-related receptor [Trichoplax sp. H2]
MAKFGLQWFILLCTLGITVASAHQESSTLTYLAKELNEEPEVYEVTLNPDFNNEESIGKVLAERKSGHSLPVENVFRQRRDNTNVQNTVALKNDSNNVAFIFYVGMKTNTILILTLSRSSGLVTNSYFYRSTNNGAQFVKSNFFNGKVVSSWTLNGLDRQKVIFRDARNPRTIYTTSDAGKTISTVNLPFTASRLSYSRVASISGYVAGYDFTKKALYVSSNMGATWKSVATNVTRYSWAFGGDDPYRIYYEYTDYNRTTIRYIKTNTMAAGIFDTKMGPVVPFNLIVSNNYIFTLKSGSARNSTADLLYVSYKRSPFRVANFPVTILNRGFLILETVDNEVVMAVNHKSNLTNLYISDQSGAFFSRTITNILTAPDSSWRRGRAYVGFYRIASLPGSYMVSQVVGKAPIGFPPSVTKISYNKGGSWHTIKAPSTDRFGKATNCQLPACSLHINFFTGVAILNRGVYTSNAAPGLVLGFGSYGKVFSRANATLYISNDGGFSWTQSSPTSNIFTALDHGSVILTAQRGTQRNQTFISYSCNGGKTFTNVKIADQTMTLLTIITEPGSKSLRASVYGYFHINNYEWIIANLYFQPLLIRKCSENDYINWTPADQYGTKNCLLGSRKVYQVKKPSSCCFNGADYSRPVSNQNCTCGVEDFECNYGFNALANGTCQIVETYRSQCVSNTSVFTTSVYRKVPGSSCIGGNQNQYLAKDTYSCVTLAKLSGNGLGAGTYVGIIIGVVVVLLVVVGIYMFRKNIDEKFSNFRRRKDEYLQEDLDHSVDFSRTEKA